VRRRPTLNIVSARRYSRNSRYRTQFRNRSPAGDLTEHQPLPHTRDTPFTANTFGVGPTVHGLVSFRCSLDFAAPSLWICSSLQRTLTVTNLRIALGRVTLSNAAIMTITSNSGFSTNFD